MDDNKKKIYEAFNKMLGDFTFDQEQHSISLVKNSNAIATWHKLKVGILAFRNCNVVKTSELNCL